MEELTPAEILALQGGQFLDGINHLAVNYPNPCEVVSLFIINPATKQITLNYDLFGSFEAFAAGLSEGNQTKYALKSRDAYEELHFEGEVYSAIIWKYQSAIQMLLGLATEIRSIDKSVILEEYRTVMAPQTESEETPQS